MQQGKDKSKAKALAEQRELDSPYRKAQTELLNAQRQQIGLPPITTPTSGQKDYEFAKSQGFKGSFLDYQTALANAKSTTIENNIGSLPFKVPAGFMLKNPSDVSEGVVRIPGSQGDSGETAKITAIGEGGLSAVKGMAQMLDSGQLDPKTMAIDMLVPDVLSILKTQNAQDFGVLRNDLTDLVGRLRSGGAISADEEPRFRNQIPAFGDSEATKRNKLNRLNEMFSGITTSVSPAGSTVEPLPNKPSPIIDEEYESLKKKYFQ